MMKIPHTNYLRHAILMACLIALVITNGYAFAPETQKGEKRLTILFTNDMHSNANPRTLPYETKVVRDGDTVSLVGGYSRLSTLINREKAIAKQEGSAVILVDAGDMAMGTIFHSVYREEAFELRSMARMGYDACTFGNHDFDYGADGVGEMLLSAYGNKDTASYKFPYMLAANIKPHNHELLERGYRAAGVKNSVMLERNGVKIGIIGLLGEHAYSVIGTKDNLEYSSPVEVAKKEVAALKQEGADFIVAISHGGTLYGDGKLLDNKYIKGYKDKKYPSKTGKGEIAMNLKEKELIYANSKLRKKSQDGTLAGEVPGIDVIISGHDHEYLYAPFIINKTIIGSSGGYNCMLGKMVLEKDSLISYELLPITRDITPNPTIQSWIDTIAQQINLKFDADLGIFPFDTIAVLCRDYSTTADKEGNLDLGHLIAKSYKSAALKYIGEFNELNGGVQLNKDDVIAVIPAGVIRNPLAKGSVTYNDVFNVLSLGNGSDGKVGYPLVMAWLNGKELKDVCEMVATVSPGMGDTRLFFDGLIFTYNQHKLPFTKVTGVKVNGVPVDPKKLYPVITGIYTAKLIGLLKSESYGILSAQPKDKNGNLIEDFNQYIIKKLTTPNPLKNPATTSGIAPDTTKTMEVTEWMAFADFLSKEGNTGKEIPVNKSAVNESTQLIYLLYLLEFAIAVFVIYSIRRFFIRRKR